MPKSEASRGRLLARLPLAPEGFEIRQWTRADLDRLAEWPAYPFPYEGFRFSFAAASGDARGCIFEERESDPSRLTLVMTEEKLCVGYLALIRIDFERREIGNLGVRIHPEHCDRGLGTSMLRAVMPRVFDCGFETIQLDVAASNTRAIRCYEKAGFLATGELWRPAPDLSAVDLSESMYAFLRPHTRFLGSGVPELRFLVMQAVASCRMPY